MERDCRLVIFYSSCSNPGSLLPAASKQAAVSRPESPGVHKHTHARACCMYICICSARRRIWPHAIHMALHRDTISVVIWKRCIFSTSWWPWLCAITDGNSFRMCIQICCARGLFRERVTVVIIYKSAIGLCNAYQCSFPLREWKNRKQENRICCW